MYSSCFILGMYSVHKFAWPPNIKYDSFVFSSLGIGLKLYTFSKGVNPPMASGSSLDLL